jgi:hypothetical protein
LQAERKNVFLTSQIVRHLLKDATDDEEFDLSKMKTNWLGDIN